MVVGADVTAVVIPGLVLSWEVDGEFVDVDDASEVVEAAVVASEERAAEIIFL